MRYVDITSGIRAYARILRDIWQEFFEGPARQHGTGVLVNYSSIERELFRAVVAPEIEEFDVGFFLTRDPCSVLRIFPSNGIWNLSEIIGSGAGFCFSDRSRECVSSVNDVVLFKGILNLWGHEGSHELVDIESCHLDNSKEHGRLVRYPVNMCSFKVMIED